MSIDLDVIPTRARAISPTEFMEAWGERYPQVDAWIHQFPNSIRPPPAAPLAIEGIYVVAFSTGSSILLQISENSAAGCDEESYLSEFGEPKAFEGLIQKWKTIGYTYSLTLGGAYDQDAIDHMEKAAAVIARLVRGYVALLNAGYSQPYGLYGPEVFP